MSESKKQAQILIYSRDMCPYCDAAKNLLKQKGVKFEEINISEKPELRDEFIKKAAPRRTFPQIFIDDKSVGGFDDINELEQKGELDKLIFST